MSINSVYVDRTLILVLVQDFLHVLIFLLKSLNVAFNSTLKIIIELDYQYKRQLLTILSLKSSI